MITSFFNSKAKFILTSLVLLGLVACKPEPKQGKLLGGEYYALDQEIAQEIKVLDSLKAGIYKQVTVNGKQEEVLLLPSNVKWENELALFKNIDLNKPAWQGFISADTTKFKGKLAGITEVTYKTDRKEIPFKHIRMVFDQHNQLNILVVNIDKEDEITHSQRTLTAAWVSDSDTSKRHLMGYSVVGYQKTRLKDTLKLNIQGQVRLGVK